MAIYRRKSELIERAKRKSLNRIKFLVACGAILGSLALADGFWMGTPEKSQETCLNAYDPNLRCDVIEPRPVFVIPYIPGDIETEYLPYQDIEEYFGHPVDEPDMLLLLALGVWLMVWFVEIKRKWLK